MCVYLHYITHTYQQIQIQIIVFSVCNWTIHLMLTYLNAVAQSHVARWNMTAWSFISAFFSVFLFNHTIILVALLFWEALLCQEVMCTHLYRHYVPQYKGWLIFYTDTDEKNSQNGIYLTFTCETMFNRFAFQWQIYVLFWKWWTDNLMKNKIIV